MPKETFFNLKNEKQERVLRSAIAEFNAHGFTKANIGIIAKNAEVAKGSMYQYFDDKNELFVHCVHWSTAKLFNMISGQMETEHIDIFEYFFHDISWRIDLVRQEKELAVFTQYVFMGRFSAMPHESIDEMMRTAEDYVLDMVRAGKQAGTVRTDISDEMINLFLTGATAKVKEHILKDSIISDDEISEERMEHYSRIAEDLTKLLKDGMGNNGNSKS